MELSRDQSELTKKVYDTCMFKVCEQCGSCSSACPLTGKEGFNIRRIIRHLELDLVDEVTDSPLPWICTTCGRCEDACPNGIKLLDIIRFLRQLSPPDLIPEGPPCTLACPAHINIPEYLRLISQGKVDDAYALIREKVPFPGILGRVCTRPCEDQCKRGDVNSPISICALKRYVADNENTSSDRFLKVENDTGHNVAIIGAGPTGLTAAFYLKKKGHQVTVFEERSEPGGMMWLAIPAYRLPQEIVKNEIQRVLNIGIELKTGKKLGRDFNLQKLKADGYEAVFIAIGGQQSRRINLEGMDLNGVLWGVDFLYETKEKKPIEMKDRVVVIGGGNVAIDVALTSLRLGAQEVTLACLETFKEMPANSWEIEQAGEEGIRIMNSWGPSRILGSNEKVTGIELVKCTSVFNENCIFTPLFDNDTKTTLDTDMVILAIGQATDLSFIDADAASVKVDKGLIVVDKTTQATNLSGIFAGGDVSKTPGTIIEAIVAGRRAAGSIDKFLGGDGIIDESYVYINMDEHTIQERRKKGFADLKRLDIQKILVPERQDNFKEVELQYNTEQGINEAMRCFSCDLEIEHCKNSNSRQTIISTESS
ncbi:MAG: FAD-dependent oxidoreductase [Proteobacteria bacterium]|nr:FAD-dependent oxidoreductase [Pseudomonadota bacterium]